MFNAFFKAPGSTSIISKKDHSFKRRIVSQAKEGFPALTCRLGQLNGDANGWNVNKAQSGPWLIRPQSYEVGVVRLDEEGAAYSSVL